MRWMVPFAMALREVGSSPMKTFPGISADDTHNIQTHAPYVTWLVGPTAVCVCVHFPSQSPVCNFIDKFVAPGYKRLFLTFFAFKTVSRLVWFRSFRTTSRVSVYRVNTTDLKSDKHKIRLLFFTVTNMFKENFS